MWLSIFTCPSLKQVKEASVLCVRERVRARVHCACVLWAHVRVLVSYELQCFVWRAFTPYRCARACACVRVISVQHGWRCYSTGNIARYLLSEISCVSAKLGNNQLILSKTIPALLRIGTRVVWSGQYVRASSPGATGYIVCADAGRLRADSCWTWFTRENVGQVASDILESVIRREFWRHRIVQKWRGCNLCGRRLKTLLFLISLL